MKVLTFSLSELLSKGKYANLKKKLVGRRGLGLTTDIFKKLKYPALPSMLLARANMPV